MGQKRAFKRFKLVPILIAGGIGYVLGGWNVTGLRSSGSSAADTIALRFPTDWNDAQTIAATAAMTAEAEATQVTPAMAAEAETAQVTPAIAVDAETTQAMPAAAITQATSKAVDRAPATPSSGTVMGGGQFALFSPEPAIPLVPQSSLQMASAEDVAVAPRSMPEAVPPAGAQNQREPAQTAKDIRPAVTSGRRRAERPHPMLDDAQIASIKRRLHLTPDQERMWPAVEVALRNLAYKTEQARRGTTAGATQLAAADPNSAEVQDLKSAAIPLIMSFSDEQKDQVRDLARSMGLDQMASEL